MGYYTCEEVLCTAKQEQDLYCRKPGHLHSRGFTAVLLDTSAVHLHCELQSKLASEKRSC